MPTPARSRRTRWLTARLGAALTLSSALLAVGLLAGAVSSPRHLHVDVSVPSVLAASGWNVWVANTGSHSVLEFDAKSGAEIHNWAAYEDKLFDSDAMVVANGQVWVANAASDTITVLKEGSGTLVKVLKGGADHFGPEPLALAATGNDVFALGHGGNTVVEFSSPADALVHVVRGDHIDDAVALAATAHDVWVLSSRPQGSLTELAAPSGGVARVVGTKDADLDHPDAFSLDGDDLWVANGAGDHLSELDVVDGRLLATPYVEHLNLSAVTSLVAAHDRLWLASTSSPAWVACVVTKTRRILRGFVHQFGYPAVFAGAGHLWVVDRTESRVTELNASTAAVVRILVS
jgi:hypothetical protein